MKLAMVITSLEVGGAEKMVLELIQKLKDKFEVRLYIIRKNHETIYDKKLSEMTVQHHYLNAKNRIFSFQAAKNLKKLLNDYKPDIIHSHLKAADYIWYYYRSQKYFYWIHTIHTLATIDMKRVRRIFYRKLIKSKKIHLISVSSEVERSVFSLYGVGGDVINNGINLEQFKYIPEEKNLFKIVHVGRFIRLKNHHYLVREFSKFIEEKKNVRLILIGDGPLRKNIIRLARKLGISKKVFFIKYTNYVEKYLREACVFVLPSEYEGMSLALLEACASGLLVIVSRSLTDLIEDEINGFEIDLDENALFYILQDLYENYQNLETVRLNAVASVTKYSVDAMAENYLKLYEKVLL
ncbi:MAG: glycosyltransferase [Bacilli bacterium]|nr:glycosyltransferase [Bacilli bacterium]